MARVTVEDCIDKVSSRFDLVVLAAQRARQIASGGALTIDRDNDKNPVVALREIAAQTIQPENLEEAIVRGMQKVVPLDESEEELAELFAEEQAWHGTQEDLMADAEGFGEEGEDIPVEEEAL